MAGAGAVIIVAGAAVVVLIGCTVAMLLDKLLPQKSARERNKRRKGVYSKIVVVLMIALNVWFADRSFGVLEAGGSVSGALVGAWFGFTTAEIGACFGIKIVKQRAINNDSAEEAVIESDG